MRSIKVILLLFLIPTPCTLFSQVKWEDKMNQLDENGQKTGLWIMEKDDKRMFSYYKKGKEDGIFYGINLRYNTLIWFGRKANERMIEYHEFTDFGCLLSSFINIQDNLIPVPKSRWAYLGQGIPTERCFCINYYSNGQKESDGILLFYEDPITESAEWGEWRYYDEAGKLTEIKIFGDTVTVLHPGDKGWHE